MANTAMPAASPGFFIGQASQPCKGCATTASARAPGERGNEEGLDELPGEHHQDPSRDKEHNDKHVIPRPPGVSIHRLSRRITHRQSKIPVMTWTLFRLWTGVRLSCR